MSAGARQGQHVTLRYASQQRNAHIDEYHHSTHVECLSPQLYAVQGRTRIPAAEANLHDLPLHCTTRPQLLKSTSESSIASVGLWTTGELVHQCSWRNRRAELSCRFHTHRPHYAEFAPAVTANNQTEAKIIKQTAPPAVGVDRTAVRGVNIAPLA